MKIKILVLALFAVPVASLQAAPDAELKALLAENNTTSQKIVDYADAKAAALVAAQAELAAVKQQLAAEKAARAKAEAERDAAVKAKSEAVDAAEALLSKLKGTP